MDIATVSGIGHLLVAVTLFQLGMGLPVSFNRRLCKLGLLVSALIAALIFSYEFSISNVKPFFIRDSIVLNKTLSKLKLGEYVLLSCTNDFPITDYKYFVTIITSYFRIKKSKHSDEEYNFWMRNFIGKVKNTPLVIYTSPTTIKLMIEMIKNDTGPIIFVICEDIWSLPWIKRPVPKIRNSTVQYDNWESAYKQQQFNIDKEKHIYTPEHYSIYNHKSWHVREVSNANPFDSNYFLWVDIGSFRSQHSYHQWPSVEKLKCLMTKFPNRILYSVHKQWNIASAMEYKISFGPVDIDDTVIGSIWGGAKSSVQWYQRTYEELHDLFYQAGQFIGKEQSIMNAISYKYHSRVMFIRSYNLPGACEPRWWYFHHFLAVPNETLRDCPIVPLLIPMEKSGNLTLEEFTEC